MRFKHEAHGGEDNHLATAMNTILAYDRLQVSDHSFGGYSHRERCSRTR
jgi:hypothetical protein